MKLLIEYALKHVGLAYRWGGDDPIEGYDCSGFVQEILASVGMDPPQDQTAHALYNYFLTRSTRSMRKGSLAFYGTPEKIVHVGLFIDSWRIIEAAGGGSKTVDKKAAARHNAFVRIRPFNHRSDFLVALFPQYPPSMTDSTRLLYAEPSLEPRVSLQ